MTDHRQSDDPFADGLNSELTSIRGRKRQSQLDFELDFFGRVLARDPYLADVLRVHAANLAAKGLYQQALQADLRLTRLEPDRPRSWYNLACSFALMGMTDKAFDALERAIKLGYTNRPRLKRDPDLKSLRGDPRFQRLLGRI
jgi:tetratricopeptide (TPR) repeat protein